MKKPNRNEYIPVTSEELENNMNAIRACWESFLNNINELLTAEKSKPCKLEYRVNSLALREIVERVYQRKDYFVRYHSGMSMSEYKEIGLNVFWLSKFKPFDIIGDGYDDHFAFNINDDFALYYMLTALKNLAKDLRLDFNSDRLSGKLYNEMLYSLSFRDLSKESLGLLVELVANIVILDLPVSND